ncbi:MarR family winged helix-turn-helix transcriptional regulator [Yimella sp. cx-51]|uniref:MarR family winged helix-turn-helix transcriptional regulator n=1 Tax=Yimella sp. cx-51 TaxID=2770551 RepID=UPI00165DB6DB|nr:MarR family winged helix-turn-helix transcriptional regulator [Yimella sp. cx-51]MBC9956612.1 winged helix-turn-helix transcriptional regulator [Yimella sp. cx-51]QTH38289.1 winged helix-turn-helix transcriptional regulator [Yimella sp. cx-51]
MPSPTVSTEVAAELANDLVHVVKKLSALRHLRPRFHPAIDASAYPVLIALTRGDHRVSAIAASVHSDVSTVSRQVSHLVSAGVAEKVADPDDGRAQVVRLTAEGHDIRDQLATSRAQWFQSMLQGWTTDEVTEFTRYLSRFDQALTHELDQRNTTGKEDA